MIATAALLADAPAAAPAARTRDWLLDGPARIASGPHAGAIAGTLDDEGRAAYAYPEIAGYYLQWLAWRRRTGVEAARLAPAARGARDWLETWLADRDPPRTRLHFDAVADWRNDAVFCFDVAMVLRGLGSATVAGLLPRDDALAGRVAALLEPLVAADGEFDACVRRAGATPLPDRWSTRRGPFLAKAAAGIVTASRALALPRHVVDAAGATFASSAKALADRPHRHVHPLLYAFEGVLSLPGHPAVAPILPALEQRFDAMLAHADAEGRLPEAVDAGPGPLRVDAVAQALRVGELLGRHRTVAASRLRILARLRDTLDRAVRTDGSVPFALGGAQRGSNTWAAMFADQALHGLAPSRASDGDPLIV